MNESQELMFDEDKQRQEFEKYETEIRSELAEVREALKRSEGYMKLLKDAPKNISDIYFRCRHEELAVQTSNLMKQQAYELGSIFDEVARKLVRVAEMEEMIAPLRKIFAPEGLNEERAQAIEDEMTEGLRKELEVSADKILANGGSGQLVQLRPSESLDGPI